MNVLVLCARFPERGHKGDQLRAIQQIELLSSGHDLTVLTAGQPSSAAARRELENLAAVSLISTGRLVRSVSALTSLLRGRPLQVGWMAPWPLERAAARAAQSCDVALVTTIRCLSSALPAPTVLDHVDTLSRNMSMRARLARNPALRLAARLEARLLRAHERRAAAWVSGQAAISSCEAAALPRDPPPVVLPLVWEEVGAVAPPVGRDIDVILTGNMRYPPNRDAARWLVAEIVPRLREHRPEIVVRVAGRAASSLRLVGVDVASDVPDLGAEIRRAKVAVVPVRTGTGVPIKLLEAAHCGAAVVCTPWAAEAAGLDVDTAEDAEGFARAVERLLADEALRGRRCAAARAGLEARRPACVRAVLERMLVDAVGTAAPTSGARA